MGNLTPEELKTYCLTAVAIGWVLLHIKQGIKDHREKKKTQVTRGKKKFPQKKWTPDGWYYDEKKQKWVGPDFPQGKE